MSTIRKVRGKRGNTFEARVMCRGRRISRTFKTQSDAKAWAAATEADMVRGVWVDPAKVTMTLGEALDRYEIEFTRHKQCPAKERGRLQRWRESGLADVKLIELRRSDVKAHILKRAEGGLGHTTLRLELAALSHLWNMARREWELPLGDNPTPGILKSLGFKPRDTVGKRIRLTEVRKLLRAFDRDTTSYKNRPELRRNHKLRHAFLFAMRTGLRRKELVTLRWSDIDLRANPPVMTVHDKDPKVEREREVVLCPKSLRILARQAERFGQGGDTVFGLTYNALGLAWADARKKCGVESVRWHDARHTATSRFFDIGLTVPEVMSQTGHRTAQTVLRYAHGNLQRIAAKLAGARA